MSASPEEGKKRTRLLFLFDPHIPSSSNLPVIPREMARSLASAARLAAAFASRRGFSSVAPRAAPIEEKVAKKVAEGRKDSPASSWVPDPVTGYYRPGNRAGEVDPAELREMLLSNRSRN